MTLKLQNYEKTKAWIFMKFETQVHQILIDLRMNFHEDLCTEICTVGKNARAGVYVKAKYHQKEIKTQQKKP